VNPISEIKIGSWWDIMIKYVTPAILIWSVVNSVIQEFAEPYGGYEQWALNIGWAVAIGVIVLGFVVFSKIKGQEVAEE
jgi:NSS family neurotransmitter:Na+ symporter